MAYCPAPWVRSIRRKDLFRVECTWGYASNEASMFYAALWLKPPDGKWYKAKEKRLPGYECSVTFSFVFPHTVKGHQAKCELRALCVNCMASDSEFSEEITL